MEWKFSFIFLAECKSYAIRNNLATLCEVTQLGRCIRSYQLKISVLSESEHDAARLTLVVIRRARLMCD